MSAKQPSLLFETSGLILSSLFTHCELPPTDNSNAVTTTTTTTTTTTNNNNNNNHCWFKRKKRPVIRDIHIV